MDPITIGVGLVASVVPELLKLFGKGKQAEIAEKVIDIAKQVTGKTTPDAAAEAIKANPELAFKFKEKLLDQEVELAKLSADVVVQVNKTMQVEATAEHWPTYSWRPFIGFSFGLWLNSVWLLPMFHLAPVMLTTDVMLAIGGILGVASWFRGKAQADPTVLFSNKG